ncbi:DUF4097 domain-containing protein [Kribbella sp. NPDC004536]|uniref:DUF4097 family beta strand repeat-containing protein n=1 Tax=Kribbella sp. NPDC004536 TaxID=3364106 RepID=UPI0036C9B9DB
MWTFSTPAPIAAAIDIIFGTITVRASDRTDTVVEVRPADPSWDLDVKAAEQVLVEYADGKLQVRHPKLRSIFSKRYGAVEVVIELPAGSDLQGYTAKGDYIVEGRVGACELKTANGDIHVAAATGNLRAKSATGNITVGEAAAEVHVRTAAGNIHVGTHGIGPVDLYTATGEVEVTVPDGTAAALDARTSIGRVFNNLDNGPATRTIPVRARTHGGNITVNAVPTDRRYPAAG